MSDTENRDATKGGPNHTNRLQGEGTQAPAVEQEDNRRADKGGPNHTNRLQGTVEEES